MQDQEKLEKDAQKLLESLGATVKKQIKIAEVVKKLFPEGTDVWVFDERSDGGLERWLAGVVAWDGNGKHYCLVCDTISADYGMTRLNDSLGSITENPRFYLKVPVRPNNLTYLTYIKLSAIKAYKLPDSNEVKLFNFQC